MKSDKIPDAVKTVRKDLTQWLWHLVRRDKQPKDTIRSIITEHLIRGSKDHLTQETVISFSEMPLRELVNQDRVLSLNKYARLSLYGIGLRKRWVFDQGGLPVVYQPNRGIDSLSPETRWRHVEFDLSKPVDYSWQREWRLRADKLEFNLADSVVLIEETSGLEDLLWKIHIDFQCEQGEIMGSAQAFKEFDFIPLEHADISDDASIDVCIADDYRDTLDSDDCNKIGFVGP
jgi:hypothetical protein